MPITLFRCSLHEVAVDKSFRGKGKRRARVVGEAEAESIDKMTHQSS